MIDIISMSDFFFSSFPPPFGGVDGCSLNGTISSHSEIFTLHRLSFCNLRDIIHPQSTHENEIGPIFCCGVV